MRVAIVTTDLGSFGYELPPHVHDGECVDDGGVFLDLGAGERWTDGAAMDVAPRLAGTILSHRVGCGYEQHLEAALRALSPMGATTWTSDDYVVPDFGMAAPLGSSEHAEFFRPDALLVVVIVTEEDDCSIAVPELLAPEGPYSDVPHNLRCSAYARETLYDVERYWRGLLQLRRRPQDLRMGIVAGFPTDLPAHADSIRWDETIARLEDQRDSFEYVCGPAAPAPRLAEVSRDLHWAGAGVVLQPTCRSDLHALGRALVAAP